MRELPPLQIARAEAFASERMVRRDHLIRWFTDLADASVVFVSGPFGMGKSTLLRSWMAHTGLRPFRLDLTAAMASKRLWADLSEALGDGSKVTVAIRHPDVERHRPALRELGRLRSQFANLQIIALGGIGWRTRADDDLRALTPTAVLHARDLCFRVAEIIELAQIRGVDLDPETARRFRSWTGGYPLAVDSMLTAWLNDGHWQTAADEASASLADALAAAVDVEPLHSDMWEALLLSSTPDVFDTQLLAQLSDQVTTPLRIETLEATGLLTVVDDAGIRPKFGYVPIVRAALRRRASVELEPQRRNAALAVSADWLAGQGEIASALDLAEAHGDRQRLRALVRAHWPELAELSAADVRARLARIGHQTGPEAHALIGHARAITDVTHAGHLGRFSGAERDYATLLLDQAAALSTDQMSDPHAGVAIESVRAVIARSDGRHDEAVGRHHRATSGLLRSPHEALTPSVRAQAGLTALSIGDYAGAANEFSYASGVGSAIERHSGRYARDLASLTSRLMDEPWPAESEAPAAKSPVSRFPSQLEHALRTLNRLELGLVWDHLQGLPDHLGDPTILQVLRHQIEGQAHCLSGTEQAGLESLDLLEAGRAAARLSGYERNVVLYTRAELMASFGAIDDAFELLPADPVPAAATAVDLVRAKLLLALGRPQDALDVVGAHARLRHGSVTRYRIWCLVLAAMAYLDQGADDQAHAHIRRSLFLASRSQNLLPFARQGTDRMGALLRAVESMYLEPGSQQVVDALRQSWHRLRHTTMQIQLTRRETVVLQHLVHTSEIRTLGRELHISPNTVKSQLRSLYRKLRASTRAEALAVAAHHGLLSAEDVTAPGDDPTGSPMDE